MKDTSLLELLRNFDNIPCLTKELYKIDLTKIRAWELTDFGGSPVNGRLTGIFPINRLKSVKNG